MLHERKRARALGHTKRMEALSVSPAAWRTILNNVLGPLVALPDLILDGLDKLRTDERAAGDMRATSSSSRPRPCVPPRPTKSLTLGRQGAGP